MRPRCDFMWICRNTLSKLLWGNSLCRTPSITTNMSRLLSRLCWNMVNIRWRPERVVSVPIRCRNSSTNCPIIHYDIVISNNYIYYYKTNTTSLYLIFSDKSSRCLFIKCKMKFARSLLITIETPGPSHRPDNAWLRSALFTYNLALQTIRNCLVQI